MKDEDSKEGILSGGQPQNREAEISVVDEDDGRQFKLCKRKLNAGLDDNMPIKLKVKVKHESPAVTADRPGAAALSTGGIDDSVHSSVPAGASGGAPDPGGGKPKWKPMGWKRATEPEDHSSAVKAEDDDHNVKKILSFVAEDQPIKDGNGVSVQWSRPTKAWRPHLTMIGPRLRSRIPLQEHLNSHPVYSGSVRYLSAAGEGGSLSRYELTFPILQNLVLSYQHISIHPVSIIIV